MNLLTESINSEIFKNGFEKANEVNSFQLNNEAINKLDANIIIDLNVGHEILSLELVEYNINDFNLRTNDNKILKPNKSIRHYRGAVNGDPKSLVALSIYENKLNGIVSTSNNEYNLVYSKTNSSILLYKSDNLSDKPITKCFTEDDNANYDNKVLLENPEIMFSLNLPCIGFYYELEYDIFQTLGSMANTEFYITSLHNQVAVIYQNEQIETSIAEVLIWTSPDPYTATDPLGLLTSFQTNTTAINGDLGHLLTFRNIGGGRAAGFDGLCNSNINNKLAVSGVNSTVNTVPNFSWSVLIVSHEFGHLFGSRHTHACVWNGNNTAIDGCAGFTEGNCSLPSIPSAGGTIMSYCHLQNVGTNLNLGFGHQPGNVIRNSVNSMTCPPWWAELISLTGPSSVVCDTPSTFTLNNVPSGATVNWSVSNSDIISISSPTNTQAEVQWNNSLGVFDNRGKVRVIATVNTDCGSFTVRSNEFWAGTPRLYVFDENFEKDYYGQSYQVPFNSGTQEIEFESDVIATYTWTAFPSNLVWTSHANKFSYLTTQSGNFTVSVSAQNACGTSNLFNSVQIGTSGGWLMVYPNPTEGELYLEWPEEELSKSMESSKTIETSSFEYQLSIRDKNGLQVYDNCHRSKKEVVDLKHLPKGHYLLTVEYKGEISNYRLVKE